MPFTYLQVVIAFTAALALLLLTFLLKKPWQGKTKGILGLLNHRHTPRDQSNEEYLLPLLVYEEAYPAFGEILGLVLEQFPIKRFLNIEEFEKALYYLSVSVFHTAERKDLISAMSVVVTTFIRDPDVEYHCRPHLKPLVNQFLEEAEEISRSA